jgi:quercetin dioxygenase-like cupin family protein
VLALAAGALLAGCAEPGQLGSSPATVTVTAPPPAPVTVQAMPETIRGTIEEPIRVRTPGRADYLVETITMQPGETTGWQQHPGTETTVVRAGTVTLLRQDACAPRAVPAGGGFFVPDAVPHLMRNDDVVPVDLVVTYLIAPGAPESAPVPAACDEPAS